MNAPIIQTELDVKVEFYDLDPMQIVWHGNYIKYMEQARCALLDLVHYSYQEMVSSGYAWPVVSLQLKYIRPLSLGQTVRIRASLIEYENRIRLTYRMFDPWTGTIINKAESIQMAVEIESGNSQLVTPACFQDKVKAYLALEKTCV